MKKIMLCCSAGMSTSMLMNKMKLEAEKRNIAVHIQAYGVSQFNEMVKDYQVVLLGPQIKYMHAELQEYASKYNIPVEPIDMSDYGMLRGSKVLDFALSLIS